MSCQAYWEEIDRLLIDNNFARAAELKAAYEDGYEKIDFYLHFEWPSYRMQGRVHLMDGGVRASAYLQGTTRSHDFDCCHLGNVFRLRPVAQDGE